MKRPALAAVAAILLSSQIFSQQPTARPNATPPATEEPGVVKISTKLIQVDVTVTDASGRVIRDLRRDEIEIYENGTKQEIANFSFVSASPAQQPARRVEAAAAPGQPPTRPPDDVRREGVFRTIALVVDDLSLSFESINETRRALRRFVNEQMQDGDLVAILRTGAGVGSLQSFTTDKRRLLLAIDRIRWNPAGTGGVSAFAAVARFSIESVVTPVDSDLSPEDAEAERNRINAFNDFRSGVFAAGTLGALQFVVRGMSEMPGRKSVVMFSDGFRLFERDRDGTPRARKVMEYMRQLVDLANRSSVVFYTIDPRGLAITSLTAVDDTRLLGAQGARAVEATRKENLFETQAGLTFLARETGGFALLNNNDLSGGVRKALEDQSYYLIGYEPDASTFDPKQSKYNQLEVKVLRKGAEVRYRSGFFNVAARPAMTTVPASATPQAKLEAAIYSPFAVNGITLRLNSLFGSTAAGSYVRSLLHIDANDLEFTTLPNGTREAAFEVLATCFGENGELADQIGRRYTLAVRPEIHRKLLADGLVYHFKFPVKKPGAYQYRVAIRDSKSDRLGTASQFLAVPNLADKQLTMSSLVLEKLSAEDYQRSWEPTSPHIPTDPMTDTALRRFRTGMVLRYSYEIYNAKLGPSGAPKMQVLARVYREGQLIMDGPAKPFELHGQTDMKQLRGFGAFAIGKLMEPGEYTLQLIVTDEFAKPRSNTTGQVIHFEVYE